MDYIDRMIAVRTDADETQKELAQALGVNSVQLSKYERKINEPSISYLLKFCQHYGVSADYILGLEPGLDWPRK